MPNPITDFIYNNLLGGDTIRKNRLAYNQGEADIAQRRAIAEQLVREESEKAVIRARTEEALRLARELPRARGIGLGQGLPVSMQALADASANAAFGMTPEGREANENKARSLEAVNAASEALGAAPNYRELGATKIAEAINRAQAGGVRNLVEREVARGRLPLSYDVGNREAMASIFGNDANIAESYGREATAPSRTALDIEANRQKLTSLPAEARLGRTRTSWGENYLKGLLPGSIEGEVYGWQAAGGRPLNIGEAQGSAVYPGPSEDIRMVPTGVGGLSTPERVRVPGLPQNQNKFLSDQNYHDVGVAPPTTGTLPPGVVPGVTIPGPSSSPSRGALLNAPIPQGIAPPAVVTPTPGLIPETPPITLAPAVTPPVQKPSLDQPQLAPDRAKARRVAELQVLKNDINKRVGGAFMESLEIGLDAYPENMSTREILSRVKATTNNPKQIQALELLEKLTDAELNIILKR